MNIMVMSIEANYKSFLKNKLSSGMVNISEECDMDRALTQLKKSISMVLSAACHCYR